MAENQKRDIILRLKEFRATHEISQEQAVNMVLDLGESTSMTTAKRLFSSGSEDQPEKFRMETLRAYEKAFFGDSQTGNQREGCDDVSEHLMRENTYLKCGRY